jgi:hypothetical protein
MQEVQERELTRARPCQWHLGQSLNVIRIAKTGKDFVTALMRSESPGETLWVNAVAFDEAAQGELMRLKAGESLSIQGAMKVSVYEKAGEHRASLDVVASHVLALRQPRRAAPRARDKPTRTPGVRRCNPLWMRPGQRPGTAVAGCWPLRFPHWRRSFTDRIKIAVSRG